MGLCRTSQALRRLPAKRGGYQTQQAHSRGMTQEERRANGQRPLLGYQKTQQDRHRMSNYHR